MTLQAAQKWADEIEMDPQAFETIRSEWKEYRNPKIKEYDAEINNLRTIIVKKYKEAFSSGKPSDKTVGYQIDINVGLQLYSELPPSQFTVVDANNDDFWRFLSCKIFPDLTYMRYPTPEISSGNSIINQKRFFNGKRRIWLKTLWWYVHLSWQGDANKTREVLKRCGADTIGHLIERTGKGYRLELYRELMRQYSALDKRGSELFNKIQVRNLVQCMSIEPHLAEGGEREYIADLIKKTQEKWG